jgi:tetratricopeptide (TPR) repeat protein
MEALRISPDSVAARIGLGSVYSGLDDLGQAAEQYARALELEPDNLQAHWGLAVTFNRLGQTEESLEHLARIVELAPGTGLALDAQNLMREIRPGED